MWNVCREIHLLFRSKMRQSSFGIKSTFFFLSSKRDERVRSGKLSWGGGQDHPLPGHEQHGRHPLHRQDHRDPSTQSLSGSVSDSRPNPRSTWPMWLRIRVKLGLCGSRVRAQLGLCSSRSGFNLAYVAPDLGSTWLCGSGSGLNMAYVALDPGSNWPMCLRIRVPLGLCGFGSGFNLAYLLIRVQLGLRGSRSVFNLAYVAPDPGSTWPLWLQIRVQLCLCGSRSGFNLDCVDPDPDSGIQKDSHKYGGIGCFPMELLRGLRWKKLQFYDH